MVIAQTTEDSAAVDFRSLMIEAGISVDDLAAFNSWNGALNDKQAELIARLLYRLEQMDSSHSFSPAMRLDESYSEDAANEDRAFQPGQLIEIEGRAVSVADLRIPATRQRVLGGDKAIKCSISLADGSKVLVISRQTPLAWKTRTNEKPLDEPVALRGILLGAADVDGETNLLVLASHIQWHPDSNVSEGVAWLVEHGFDAALFDEVRHDQPFAKANDSRESQAFCECLSIVSGGHPAELARLARAELPEAARKAKAYLKRIAQQRRELTAQGNAASLSEKKHVESKLADLRRREIMATQTVARAEQGLSSVWQTFLAPKQSTGQLFLIEGTARRAVRIEIEEPERKSGSNINAIREYYELDVFTTDVQNPLAVCCVARLPDGFPTGEVINEPVRVAGVFFKKWAYVPRTDDTADNDRRPRRLAPPILIAAEPEWLRIQDKGVATQRGLWGGLAFLGLVTMLWVVLARVARRDRLAYGRRARYDSRLQDLPES
jgi:hypothetical protein